MQKETRKLIGQCIPRFWSPKPPWAYWPDWESDPGLVNLLWMLTRKPRDEVLYALAHDKAFVNRFRFLKEVKIGYRGEQLSLTDSTLFMPAVCWYKEIYLKNKVVLDRAVHKQSWSTLNDSV